MSDNETETKPKGQLPRYQVLEKCYLPIHTKLGVVEHVLDPEAMPAAKDEAGVETGERVPLLITFEGVPAHYLKPVNEAARAMVKKHQDRMQVRNPINEMTSVTAAA